MFNSPTFKFIVNHTCLYTDNNILYKGEVYTQYSSYLPKSSRYIAIHKSNFYINTINIFDSEIHRWIKEKYIIVLHQ